MKSQLGQVTSAFSSRDFLNAGVKREEFDLIFADMFPMRILIVEDDYISRRIMTMFLTNLGYEPDSVETGQECLDAAVRNSYDLILMHLDMAESSGVDCITELRRLHLDVFIIAVTGTEMPGGRVFSREAGADSYLAKPFDGKELKLVLLDAFADLKEKLAAHA